MLIAIGILTGLLASSSPLEFDQFERIVIAGDSTAADYPAERRPQAGWGEGLRVLISPLPVLNLAVPGRSTRSYIEEGHWEDLAGQIKAGDLVLISFGHNDSRDDAKERYAAPNVAYRENLVRFAQDVKAAGGRPVLLSPVARRLWEGPAMVETHGMYRHAAATAAYEADVDFIDLSQLSLDYFERFGPEGTKRDFIWLDPIPGHPRFANGAEDNTHFTPLGACGVALVIAREIGLAQLEGAEDSESSERSAAVRKCSRELPSSH